MGRERSAGGSRGELPSGIGSRPRLQVGGVDSGLDGREGGAAGSAPRRVWELPARRNGGGKPCRIRVSMTIGLVNMRGAGPSRADGTPDKWMCINQVMREHRIAVLAVQETHLSIERIERLNVMFKGSLKVFGSPDGVNPTAVRGVAIVINKKMVDVTGMVCVPLVQGRAVMVVVPWSRGVEIAVVGVYAPNNHAENAAFWRRLDTALAGRRVDIMAGDYNMVENSIDRLPARNDPGDVVVALQEMCGRRHLRDEWRMWNPRTLEYTLMQDATGSQSRIDRVYVNTHFRKNVVDWETCGPGFLTDHRLVLCKLANRNEPYKGRGRWKVHGMLLLNGEFFKQVKGRGMKLVLDLARTTLRTEENNIQTMFAGFKRDVKDMAMKRAKERVPKIDKRIALLKEDLKTTLAGAVPSGRIKKGDAVVTEAAVMQGKIAELEVKRFGNRRLMVAARDWLEGERMSKYWMKTNCAVNEDETMYELARPVMYENRLAKMADLAKEHYDGVQKDEGKPVQEVHAGLVEKVLAKVDAKLDEAQKKEFEEGVQYAEVDQAIVAAANGKAPGLDGILAEVWKELRRMYTVDRTRRRPAFDVVTVLRDVFNDVVEYGVATGMDFTLGWICPIYKMKGDKRVIENYRPITLLNADYKLFTKVLANRVAKVVHQLVHPDQAGFVLGRRIHHQTKLAQMVIDYCEAEEVNGVVVALDQEKAYNKIDHDYLWRVLEYMNFPRLFIGTLKHLYGNAESVVVVNGVPSGRFWVVRGVRQGDPMLCLLFDLAIEPLACALRKSSLRGLEIPGLAERIVAALFADDTMVYLHESDSYEVLEGLLVEWCAAARAKFSPRKTMVVPVGTPAYRESVVVERSLTQGGEHVPGELHIVRDGEAVHLLGAWVGNGIDEEGQWVRMIAIIRDNLARWAKRNPSRNGRKLIVGLEVGSRTQYLTKVQVMPPSIQGRIVKMVKMFMNGGDKSPRVGIETIYRPVAEGGVGLLDLVARNEAINVMWLKEYLQFDERRPKWAYLADRLFARSLAGVSKNTVVMAQFNSFLQTWKVSAHPAAGLPGALRRLLKVAVKHGVQVEVANPAEGLKLAMPSWYHTGSQEGRVMMNTAALRCLRACHGVMTIADCMNVSARLPRMGRKPEANHRGHKECGCYDCVRDRIEKGCDNPHRCAEAAWRVMDKLTPLWAPEARGEGDGLSLKTEQRKRNVDARRGGEDVVFDPSVTSGSAISEVFRIFVPRGGESRKAPARRRPARFDVEDEKVVAYTDGSALRGGRADASAGCGVWCGEGNPLTRVALAPPFVPLSIISDSKYAIKGLTMWAGKWESEGWIGVANKTSFRDALARLHARSARTMLRWVKGHSGVCGNEEADQLARVGVEMGVAAGEALPSVPDCFLLRGAALSNVTQKLVYRGIREGKKQVERMTTRNTMGWVVAAVREQTGKEVMEESVWKAARAKYIPRRMQDFLWNVYHGAHRIGRYWSNIPTIEERAICVACGAEETMEHILVDCEVVATTEVRRLMGALLLKKHTWHPKLSFGILVGAPVVTYAEKLGKCTPYLDRFFRVVVMESTHLIWKLRCERVIEFGRNTAQWHSVGETRNRWYAALNKRLKLDRALTNKRLGYRATEAHVVRETWKGVLNVDPDEGDWLKLGGVLVGKLGDGGNAGVG